MISIEKINDDIQKAVRRVQKAARTTPQEPDYTVALALKFPEILRENNTLPSNIKVGGCFIHQSPKVEFTYIDQYNNEKIGRCELGDMIVFIRKHMQNDEMRYNAALLQMKKVDGKIYTLSGRDKIQLSLYIDWPKFSVVNNQYAFHNPYDLYPKTANQGAMYCLIQNKAHNIPQFYMSEARKTMKVMPQYTLGRFIVNMIDWHTGRAVDNIVNENSDKWSKLIWDTLLFTSDTNFNRRNVNYVEQRRYTLSLMQDKIEKTFFGDDVEDILIGRNPNAEDADSGFGILFIDVDEREQDEGAFRNH